MKIATAIREGRYVFSTDKKKDSEEKDGMYLIWNEEEDEVVIYYEL